MPSLTVTDHPKSEKYCDNNLRSYHPAVLFIIVIHNKMYYLANWQVHGKAG